MSVENYEKIRFRFISSKLGLINEKIDRSIKIINREIVRLSIVDCLNIFEYQKLHFMIVQIPYENFIQT